MERSFLQSYLDAFQQVEGWFHYDAALMFMAFNQLIAQHNISGNVLEIGVHHGLSSIGTAALRGQGKLFYAVDLFEHMQEMNVSRSGGGNRPIFERNMRRFYPDSSFIRIIPRATSDVKPADLEGDFSFCHIDGGHSRKETFHDLTLSYSILLPGGLVALDDYFNPDFPGVCEGCAEFMLKNTGALLPVAIGFNKVLFQKRPVSFDLKQEFASTFGYTQYKLVQFWDEPTVRFPGPMKQTIDLYASSPQRLVPMAKAGPRAVFIPEKSELIVDCGKPIVLPVKVRNASEEAFPAGPEVFGLSYHLRSSTGGVLVHDGSRTWFTKPLGPGEVIDMPLQFNAPSKTGTYEIEIDLVWEQVMWFSDIGNPTSVVRLIVR